MRMRIRILTEEETKKEEEIRSKKKTETCNVINFVDRLSTLTSGKNKKRT